MMRRGDERAHSHEPKYIKLGSTTNVLLHPQKQEQEIKLKVTMRNENDMNITEHFPKHHTDMTITIDKNLSWKLQ
jgi:hypothetical protein